MTTTNHERLAEIFGQVCDLPPADRTDAIARACGGDEELRRQIERLLEADAAEGDVLADTAIEDGSHLRAVHADHGNHPPDPPDYPERIGPFTIVRKIGHGGMGVVFEAVQDGTRRPIALKIIRPGMFSERSMSRFKREAEVLGLLQHPGIAQIYESGTYEGRPYIAMELVDGLDLKRYAEENRLGHRERLELVARVADAVLHAHQKGVVHRDLKPENVLVRPEPTESTGTAGPDVEFRLLGRPKVLDFGIARAVDHALGAAATHTISGQLIGTIAYMSPEQLRAHPDIDARTDVFSLGTIAYELLSGRPPCQIGDKPLASALSQRLDAPVAPLGTLDRRFRGDIETIVGKAMETDRQRRYQSMAEMAADIRRHLLDEPVQARPPSFAYQLSRFTRRNRVLVAGIVATLIALLAGLAGTASFAVRSNDLLRDRERLLYAASVDAASRALHRGDHDLARSNLDRAPEQLREWEWRHIDQRLGREERSADLSNEMRLSKSSDPVWDDSGQRFSFLEIAPPELIGVATVDADRLEIVGRVPITAEIPDLRHAAVLHRSGSTIVLALPKTGALEGQFLDARTGRRTGTLHLPKPDRVTEGRVTLTESGPFHFVYLDRWRVIHEHARTDHEVLGPLVTVRTRTEGDESEEVLVARAGSGEILHRFPASTRSGIDPIFTRSGDIIVFTDPLGRVAARDTATGRALDWSPLESEEHWVHRFRRTDGPNTVLAEAQNGVVIMIDLEVGAIDAEWRGPSARVQVLGVRPGTGEVVAVSKFGTVSVWHHPHNDPAILRGHEHWIESMDLAPHGRLLATGDWAGSIRFWDTKTRGQVGEIRLPSSDEEFTLVRSLEFSADGRSLLAVWSHGWTTPHRVQFFDVESGRMVRDITTIPSQPTYASMHADGGVFVSSFADYPIHRERRYTRIGNAFSNIAFAPGQSDLAAIVAGSARNQSLRFFNPRTLRVCHEFGREFTPRSRIAFSRDGSLLAATAQRSVLIHRSDDGSNIAELKGHTDVVFDIAWSPDGTRIATASRDKTIGIWDARTFEKITSLYGHEGLVMRVAWAPDSQTLYSASYDGTVRAWSASPHFPDRREPPAR